MRNQEEIYVTFSNNDRRHERPRKTNAYKNRKFKRMSSVISKVDTETNEDCLDVNVAEEDMESFYSSHSSS